MTKFKNQIISLLLVSIIFTSCNRQTKTEQADKVVADGQIIGSGEYDSGLKLAYDSKTNKLTGYFENYTGLDEKTGNPKFSCIFYIQGTITGSQFTVDTYDPNNTSDIIKGNIQIINDKTATINLPKEHGGCWNVRHFAKEEVKFSLEKYIAWAQIRFIAIDKAYLHTDKSIDKKQISYLVKNDFVCIDKIEDDWAFCTYYGKTIAKGWIRTSDLNKL
jgi:hypothetical protein